MRDGVERNAYLESFMVHARCLDEFFNDLDESNGLMKPWHFGYGAKPTIKPARHPQIGRMNAEIAHLGYNRKSAGESGHWKFIDTLDPLIPKFISFLEYVEQDAAMMAFGINQSRTAELLVELRTLSRTAAAVHAAPMSSSALEPKPAGVPDPKPQRAAWPPRPLASDQK